MNQSAIRTTSPLARRLVFCAALLPPFFLAALIFTYAVDIPQWDEWECVSFFQAFSQGSLTFSHLFAQNNEYRQLFPNILFVSLGWLTRGDGRYEMWISFLLAGLVSFNIYRLAKLTIVRDGLRWGLFFLANTLIFSPTQYQNWFQGQQLIYYVPIACITTCIMLCYSGLPPFATFSLCACLSTISTFSSANGGLCWLVVLPVLLTAKSSPRAWKNWLVLGWIAGFLANATFYLYGFHRRGAAPSLFVAFAKPLTAIVYLLGFLGAPLGVEKGKLAALFGLLLISLFAIGCVVLKKFRHDSTFVRRMIPWLMIGAYSILTAGMCMFGRLGFGVGQSMNARYIGFSVYLVISLIFLVPLSAEKLMENGKFSESRLPVRVAAGLAILLILWQPMTYVKGIQGTIALRKKLLQAKASLLLINLVQDRELVNNLYPDLTLLTARANILDQLDFLRPKLLRSKRVQDFQSDKATDVHGSLDHCEVSGKYYILSGNAALPYRGEAAHAVILAYEQPNGDCIPFALTHPKFGTSLWVTAATEQRWEQPVSGDQLPFHPVKLTAWAFDANSARAFRLNGSYVIP